MIIVLACAFTAVGVYNAASTPTSEPTCSINGAPLACASGTVLGSVLVAKAGSFAPGADCNPSSAWDPLLPECPLANVATQVHRLCRGQNACNISCACAPAPAPPTPPTPPGTQPAAPRGFHTVKSGGSSGSCRDSHGKEPAFYTNDNADTASVEECESACISDPHCTALSYCTKFCAGSCHLYTDLQQPPATHPTWAFNPGQQGDPHNVTRVAPGADFWWCFAKDMITPVAHPRRAHKYAEPHSHVPTIVPAPPLPTAQCRCTSVENNVNLAFLLPPGGAACRRQPNQTLAVRAECVPSGPPPPPPPPPPSTVPTSLRLEFLEPPVLGLDNLCPQFGWTLPHSTNRRQPHEVQSAAEVVVRNTQGVQIWSSGRVLTTAPRLVPNASLPLTSDTAYTWSVRVWSTRDHPTAFAIPANFTTGLLVQADWGNATWIVGGSLLRTEFVVPDGAVERVSLFVSACQYYMLYLDGRRVGDHELDVAWTKFAEYRSYVTYELEPSLLRPGKHALGMMIGQGFCGGSAGKAGRHQRAGLLRLVIHSAPDDEPLLVVTTSGRGWDAGSGPVLRDSTYYGTDYDARLEQPGWTSPGFTPSAAHKWVEAREQTEWPADDPTRGSPPAPPAMSSQLMQPIKAVRQLLAVSVHKSVASGVTSWTYDFGQEFAGVVRLQLPPHTAAGTNVTLKYAEVLAHPGLAPGDSKDGGGGDQYDGRVYMKNLFWAHPEDSYIARGGDTKGEQWQPPFTEHGFRYVQLTVAEGTLPEEPTLSTLTGINLRTSAREQSRSHYGQPLLQILADNSWWTEAAALMSIPNGAAGRGERAGWTGDSAFASESECFDFDTGAFFSQFMNQIRQGQCADGTIGNVVPATDPRRDGPLPFGGTCKGLTQDATWATVYPTIAHNLWKYYDAVGVVANHWDDLKRYVGFLEGEYRRTGLKDYFCKFGDWNPVVRTSCHVTSSASFLHDLRRMAEMAIAIGETADALYYRSMFDKLRPEWHVAFWNPKIGMYDAGTQMAQAVAIWLDIVPDPLLPKLVSKLARDVVENGLTVGFVGVRYMFEALAKSNRTQAALECIARPGYPGYHYELYNEYEPATSLWESWNVPFQTCIVCETSRDHHYQASINTFLRRFVTGLDMADGSAGWAALRVRPEAALVPKTMLSFASVTVLSHRGVIHFAWEHAARGEMTMHLTVPSGSVAEVHVPKNQAIQSVTESNELIWTKHGALTNKLKSIRFVNDDGRFLIFSTGSGTYFFETRIMH